MEYQATAKYIRGSTRKLRLIGDVIYGLDADTAVIQLKQMVKTAAEPMLKVLQSAIANAKQKDIKSDNLKIKFVEVMGGPGMKRWHAVSRGSGHAYKKKMTHVRIILTEKVNQAVKSQKKEEKGQKLAHK
jgi:large subunit ribosomal protein L22